MDISRIKTEFGLRLRAFRQNKKMTQEKFSEQINLNFVNLSNIENGKKYPDFITLCSIIENAGASPDYLLGFLKEESFKYDAADLEIMKQVIKLSERQKLALNNFLESMQ